MKLFLDTSVLLAASASSTGASRAIFDFAPDAGWSLLTTPYILGETLRNLAKVKPNAYPSWMLLSPLLKIMPDVLTIDRPVVFARTKDRPVLFGALAWANFLITLDHADFGPAMASTFYGLTIIRPGDFLELERAAGRLPAG